MADTAGCARRLTRAAGCPRLLITFFCHGVFVSETFRLTTKALRDELGALLLSPSDIAPVLWICVHLFLNPLAALFALMHTCASQNRSGTSFACFSHAVIVKQRTRQIHMSWDNFVLNPHGLKQQNASVNFNRYCGLILCLLIAVAFVLAAGIFDLTRCKLDGLDNVFLQASFNWSASDISGPGRTIIC